MTTPGTTTGVEPRPHQGDDLDVWLLWKLAGIFVGGIVSAILIAALLFHLFAYAHPHRTSEAAPLITAADLPPEPRLQMAPLRDLEAVHAAEDQHLTRYAWTDPAHGTAQIPIDRAMTLWLQTQGAAPATNAPPVPGPTELQMRQDKAKEAPHAP